MTRQLTLQKQTRLHANGVLGNCMMACYANYLGLDVEQCPRIEKLFSDSFPLNFWCDAVKFWWEQQGYEFQMSNNEQDVLEAIGDDFYFVGGKSNNTEGINHMVIYQGGKMIFDPNPEGKGIHDPFRFEYVIKR